MKSGRSRMAWLAGGAGGAAALLALVVQLPATAAQPNAGESVQLTCGDQAGLPSVDRDTAMSRGMSWVSVNVPYDQGSCHSNENGTYREDCSGFVSMAWGLTSSYVTWTLPDVAHPIALADLQPGDILLIPHDHTEMFVRWTDQAHTRADLMGETYPGNGTVTDADQPLTTGYWAKFTPYRYNNIQG